MLRWIMSLRYEPSTVRSWLEEKVRYSKGPFYNRNLRKRIEYKKDS